MLELKNITYRVRHKEILSNISLSFCAEHKCIVILGASGSGKTTLLRLIAGLEKPTTGKIFWQNIDISQEPPYKRRFSMVFQNPALFPHLSVLENVMIGIPNKSSRCDEAYHWLQCFSAEHLAERSIAYLSGGESQRVGLARACAAKPRLLLLDEPWVSIDRITRRSLMQSLWRSLQKLQCSMILVSHDLEDAWILGDFLCIVSEGRIVFSKPMAELSSEADKPLLEKFLGSWAWQDYINALPLRALIRGDSLQ